MDSFELNKIIGAVLGTVFVVFSLNLISDTLFAAHSPEKPGYIIESAEPSAGPAEGGVAAAPEPVGPLLASADVGAGEALFKRCAACHTPDNGGANKIGPNLWSIVDRPVASHEGYAYSAAMKAHAGERPTWDYEHLSDFLTAPKALVKGTAMNFPGIKAAADRANIIAYLRTLADTPAPLPEAAPAPAAAAPATDAPAAAPAAPGAAEPTAPTVAPAPPATDTAAPPPVTPAPAQ